jgi:hypothetical protein
MTNKKSVRRRQQGRIFPEFTIPPEELAKREAERNARGEKARVIFNRVRPELINDHYNWFMVNCQRSLIGNCNTCFCNSCNVIRRYQKLFILIIYQFN